jgi:DNA-binding beta-propeller fold protein YncE
MVQLFLTRGRRRLTQLSFTLIVGTLVLPAAYAANGKKSVEVRVPELLLDGGRKLTFERSISSDRDVNVKHGFFGKVFDAVVGAPDFHFLVRPYEVVTDSRGRVLVTDPGAKGIHVFDFAQHKYKFIERRDKRKDPMLAPQCIAVDGQDNIYITDSESGKIFVFEPSGKYQRSIGSLKGGEGYFKRPTGIAVDSAAQRIYVTDTLRNKVYILDMEGHVLNSLGKHGAEKGEFNFPTELRLEGQELLVVDAMNFRVQAINLSGQFDYAVGQVGDGIGSMFRPKGIGVDSEGHIYESEAVSGIVQVFDRDGQLLYYFGQRGTGFGEFRLPAGLFIDHSDRVYVVDSYNARVQVFQYHALQSSSSGGTQ